MNPQEAMRAIHTKWIKDLRSGKFVQAQSTLCAYETDAYDDIIPDTKAYCCLGVLAVTNDYDEESLLVDDLPRPVHFGSKNPAHQYVTKLRELDIHDVLASANDAGTVPRNELKELTDYGMTHDSLDVETVCFYHHSFNEIADYLEEIQEPFLKTFTHATD